MQEHTRNADYVSNRARDRLLIFLGIIFAAADVVDGDTKEQMRAQERNTHGEEESTIFS